MIYFFTEKISKFVVHFAHYLLNEGAKIYRFANFKMLLSKKYLSKRKLLLIF